MQRDDIMKGIKKGKLYVGWKHEREDFPRETEAASSSWGYV